MYFVFNKEGECVASCSYEPDAADLLNRDEFCIESDELYDISKIAYQDGQIVEVVESLDKVKENKITELKTERDMREVQVIQYKDKSFDYDDKARERMRIAQQALEDNGLASQMWTCADNTMTELSVQDFKNINTLAAQRSGELHEQYNKLKVLVSACVSKEEVLKITFDTDTSKVKLTV